MNSKNITYNTNIFSTFFSKKNVYIKKNQKTFFKKKKIYRPLTKDLVLGQAQTFQRIVHSERPLPLDTKYRLHSHCITL